MTDLRPAHSATQPLRTTGSTAPRPALDAVPRVERVSPSLLKVVHHGATIGFVEKVGPVFVALIGAHYDRAVEVAQYRELERAAHDVIGRI